MATINLTAHDRESAVWKKYEAFLRERLVELSRALEHRSLAQVDAEYFRGQINLIRETLYED